MKVFMTTFALLLAMGTMAQAQTCATLSKQWDDANSSSLKVYDGQRISNMNDVSMVPGYQDWDNKVDKVVVNPGCTLVVYQYQNYNVNYYTGEYMDGFKLVFGNVGAATSRVESLYRYRADRVSSLKCFCQ